MGRYMTRIGEKLGAKHDVELRLSNYSRTRRRVQPQRNPPSAMIVIRNENGSHNPGESFDLDDLRLGTKLLAWALLNA